MAAHTASLQLIHPTVSVVCVRKGSSPGLRTHATSSLRHHTKYVRSQVAPVVSNFPSWGKFGRLVGACMQQARNRTAARCHKFSPVVSTVPGCDTDANGVGGPGKVSLSSINTANFSPTNQRAHDGHTCRFLGDALLPHIHTTTSLFFKQLVIASFGS